jgi:hypothetical protein
LHDGERFCIGVREAQAQFSPGHTLASIAYLNRVVCAIRGFPQSWLRNHASHDSGGKPWRIGTLHCRHPDQRFSATVLPFCPSQPQPGRVFS